MGRRSADHGLLEREAELAVLDDALAAPAAGHGSVVLIEGPPGIGKSGLLAAAAGRARSAGCEVVQAVGIELEQELPFGVVRQLLEPVLVRATLAERAALLAGAARLAAPVVDPAHDEEVPTGGDRGFAVLHGLHWLCANLATRRPLVLVLDDVQWADEGSLRWVAHVAHRLADVPACVLLAARDTRGLVCDEVLAAVAANPSCRVVVPAPLSEHSVGRILQQALGVEPAAGVVAACQRRAEGNPFVVREVAGAVRRARLPVADPASSAAVERLLPGSVARDLVGRLARLSPSAIAVARGIAVLETDVALVDVARLTALPEDAAADAIDELVGSGLVRPDLPLCFAHVLMREAVYGDLPGAHRVRLHRRAAEILAVTAAPERVAAHLLACEPHGDAEAVALLRRCARRALERGAARAAVRYLARALAEGPPPAERSAVLRELGAAEVRTGVPDAVVHLEEAGSLAASPAEAADVALELGGAFGALGRMTEAVAALEDGIDVLQGRDRERALRLTGELGAYSQLDTVTSVRAAERLRRAVPGLTGATPGERLVLASYAHLRSNELAVPEELGRLAELAIGDGLLLADQTADAATTYLLAYVLFRAERHEAAERWLAAALDEAQGRGSLLGATLALGVRAHLRTLRGELEDGEADARTSMDAQRQNGWASVLPIAAAALSDCVIEREDPAAADALWASAGLDGDLPPLQAFVWAQAARGRARVAAGRADVGLADLLGCDQATVGRRPAIAMHWRADAALALAALGEHDRARELAGEHVRLAREAALAPSLGVGLRVLGRLTPGPSGERLLAEAVEVLAASSARFEHARALVDLGSAVRRAGRRSEARDSLRAGYDLARRCGGLRLAERAGEELAASGARLRRPDLSGRDALTPSERRVAELAATGLSNPQIAQRLFVTRKTVEMHLGRAYRKLEVLGRDDLAAALAPPA